MLHPEGVDVIRVPSLIENGSAFVSSPYPMLDPQKRKRKGSPKYSRKVSSIKVSRTKYVIEYSILRSLYFLIYDFLVVKVT